MGWFSKSADISGTWVSKEDFKKMAKKNFLGKNTSSVSKVGDEHVQTGLGLVHFWILS